MHNEMQILIDNMETVLVMICGLFQKISRELCIKKLTFSYVLILGLICDAYRDLVPFVKF